MNDHTDSHFCWNNKDLCFLLFIPVLSVLLFLVFVFLLRDNDISHDAYWQIQQDYFIAANQYLSSFPTVWLNLTYLGDGFVLFPLLSFFIIFRPQVWIALFAALPLGFLLSEGGKRLAEMPRPASVLAHDQITTIGSSITAHTSLPSGHTVTVFAAVTVILGVLIPKPRRYAHYFFLGLGLVIATVLALSRVAVGAHWPLDLLVGSVFGYFAGISGVLFTQKRYGCWHWLGQPNCQLLIGIIMLVWSIFLARNAYLKSPEYFLLVVWGAALTGIIVSLHLISRKLECRE